jgi:tricarboxylate carrier
MSFQSVLSRKLATIGTRALSVSRTSIRHKAVSATAESSGVATKGDSVPVGKALLATVAGVVTVSGVSALVEYGTASSVPPFDPNGQRFSQDDFSGRFSKMLLACDPRLLLYSEEQVRSCESMIQNYESYSGKEMDRALWEAKRIKEAAIHPDTGDVIPRPFRMSGYVPFNGPVAVAMVASQSTIPLLFWSWVNQSQNALVNYFNRNACSPMSNETLATSYAAAVGSALAVAFGLSTLIQKRFPAEKAKLLMRYIAFPSSVVASSLNCYIVRSPEIKTGIPLMDEDGHDVLEGETSTVAAQRGVNSTTASRALLQAPVYFLPPVLVSAGFLKAYLIKNPTMTVPITTYLLLVCFGVGLPSTVAIFPQMAKIDPNDAEPKFQHLRDSNGRPYEVYYYNKGL